LPPKSVEKSDLRLIILAAPSGGGKTTLCELLLKDFPTISLSISTTTRPKRPTEQNGVHYHFVSEFEFEEKIKAHAFAEWAFVHQNRYGTARKTIEDCFNQGKHILFDIDVQGAKSLKTIYHTQALLIFILPPSMEELERRLRARKGDNESAIQKRLENARQEIAQSGWFDYRIVNENLDKTYQELKEIVKRECKL
jgi:guanylate kinase